MPERSVWVRMHHHQELSGDGLPRPRSCALVDSYGDRFHARASVFARGRFSESKESHQHVDSIGAALLAADALLLDLDPHTCGDRCREWVLEVDGTGTAVAAPRPFTS